MSKQHRETVFTTIAIETETNKLVEKICKRYSLKKGEIVKLAFLYLDKAHINPADAPESVKSEFADYGSASFSGHGIERLSDEGRRVKELEKKLKTKELELEILKKAIAVFSKIDK